MQRKTCGPRACSKPKLRDKPTICIGIVATSARANSGAAVIAPVATELEGFSILSYVSFIGDVTKCITDVFRKAIAPHPSCCDAIAKLKDCSLSLLKEIPHSTGL